MKRTGRLFSLLLAVVMVVSLLPVTALAEGGGQQEPSSIPTPEIGTLTYTDKSGTSHTAMPSVLGETKYAQGQLEFNATVYLAELPFGVTVTDYTKTAGSNMAQVIHSSMAASTNATAFATALTANDSYLDGTDLPSGEGLASNSQYKTQIVPVLNTEGIRTGIPNANVKGFAIKELTMTAKTAAVLIVVIPTTPVSEIGNVAIGELNYLDANNVSQKAVYSVLGETKYTQGTLEFEATVYLAELPSGATVTDYTKTVGSNMAQVIHSSMAASTNATAFATALTANDSYLDGTDLPSGEGLASNSQYKTQIVPVLNTEGIRTGIPNANVKGFAIKELTMTAKTAAVLIVTIEDSSINRDALDNEIAKVWNVESNTYTNNYYTENDRWNGTNAYPKDENNPTRGFFWDATEKEGNPLTTALGDFSNQTEVDAAAEALSSAILDLIPSEQANTTLLYEALHAKWFWAYSVYERVPTEWTSTHQGDPEWVTADSTTYASWMPYAAALDDAQEMMDTLFDADGKATEANKSSLNTQIAALVAALDVSKLVNKEDYTQNYNYFLEHEATAEALLTQADPTELDQESYSSISWGKLVDAWNALERDLNHWFEGGSREDMDILIAFPSHLDALQKAYQGLVSDTDITVDFTYVNNFAAKYPALRSAGQDILQVDALPLENGQTTVQDAVTAAYVQFDSVDIRGFVIPGDINNTSDTSPVYLVYVNGKYMGNSTQTIQLHDNDDVRVVRICKPVNVTEVSTGQSGSSNLENPTLDTVYLGDSLAMITMTAPEAPKVGDKATFSATLTGAYGSNVGEAFNAGNITLFVSEPYTDETEHFTHQPTANTGVSTDASGKLEYVFSEPGWYAVAMFNVEDDTPTFTDIYDSTTDGVYPSVYAGDFSFVYVAPSEDEAKLIAQYKAEYAATAKAYYDGFHDYDFADGFYTETFKPQYETLLANLENAGSFKALKEQFETDFALLKEYGATAIDHQAAVDALREKLGYLPEEISALSSSHAAQVSDIQTAYAAMGAHTKTLLTQAELDRLEQIAAIDVSALPAAAAVTVQIQTIGSLPLRSGNGNPYYGYPNLAWVKTPNPDGTIDNPVWATTYDTSILNAKAGDHVFVRKYLDSTDAQYRMVWSVDGGTIWTPASPQTLMDLGGNGSYDGYYLVEYVVPQDVADGSTVTIQLKMWSKTEYDANGIDATKESALAAVQAAYDSYDLTKYDDAGKAALMQALEDGKASINAATTNDAVTAARKTAIGAMAAVRKNGEGQNAGDFDSGKLVGSVSVVIENTIYGDTPFYGRITGGEFAIGEKDSMMTVVLRALHDAGFAWNGTTGNQGDGGAAADYTITYLGSINKDGDALGEFSGNAKSGWMGTLNDWFVNESFSAFSVANGKLESGDEIRVMFTMELGADLGGTWGNNDTSLTTLTVTGGKLSPAFDGATTEYTLIVPENGASVTVYPVPLNKNYQSRIFLNDYNKDSAQYKRTDVIAVKPGDTIYVGVGERGWPTMNSGGRPTKYVITVATADGALDGLDAGKVTLSNYKEYAAKLDAIDRGGLSDAGKEKYDAIRERIASFAQIDAVKQKLAALPKSENATDAQVTAAKAQIEAADAAYKALSTEQQAYITVADVSNYNELVERLAELTPDTTAETITGSDKMPEAVEDNEITVEPEVKDGEAKAEISADSVTDALKDANPGETLTVKVETKDADSVEAALSADAVQAAAAADVDLHVDTEVGTVKVDADTVDELAKDGKDVAVSVTENADGTTTVDVTVDGKTVDATVKVELPAAEAGQVLVIVNADGTETVVKKSVVEGDTVYAEIPAGATVKVVEKDASYGDVKDSDWFAEDVEFVTTHGLFEGTNKGFEPTAPMTRGMLATVLYRLEDAVATGSAGFADLASGKYYTDPANWAGMTGIIEGDENGFDADKNVTREQIATILFRYANYIGLDTSARASLGSFPDGDKTATWAKDAMSWAVAVGIFEGSNSGLNPGGDATRAQVAALFTRMVKLIVM